MGAFEVDAGLEDDGLVRKSSGDGEGGGEGDWGMVYSAAGRWGGEGFKGWVREKGHREALLVFVRARGLQDFCVRLSASYSE